jgi:hypothetical protein
MKALSGCIAGVTRPIVTPQKALWAGLCLSWPKISGRLAEVSRPLRLQWMQGGGTLWLGVWGGSSFLISHESSFLMDSVNRYAGYKAVVRMRYKALAPPIKVLEAKKLPEVSDEARAWAQSILDAKDCRDERLERALLSIGSRLYT